MMTETNKPKLASATDYFDKLREEGLEEERRNKGYVWTILIDGPAQITVPGLATVDYNLRLNCSHVGETPYGVYRGEMDFDFKGDFSGAFGILSAIGFSMKDDSDGWFKNHNFVMKMKPYETNDEEEFIETFTVKEEEPEDQEEQLKQQLKQAMMDMFLPAQEKDTRTAEGIWYDWDFHMTEGDMSTYLKISGGVLPFAFVKGHGETDAKGTTLNNDAVGYTIFGHKFTERYTRPIDSPFPYTLKMYEDGSVLFTLYNNNGGPVTVNWTGKIDKIPVEETIVVE